MVSHNTSSSANWVAGCAVGAKDRSIAVQTGEIAGSAWVLLLACAIEDVVRLVCGVHDIAPQQSRSNLSKSALDKCEMMGRYLLALPAEEVLSIPVDTGEHPPGPPKTSPTTWAPSE
jgi:hypothetical protein